MIYIIIQKLNTFKYIYPRFGSLVNTEINSPGESNGKF